MQEIIDNDTLLVHFIPSQTGAIKFVLPPLKDNDLIEFNWRVFWCGTKQAKYQNHNSECLINIKSFKINRKVFQIINGARDILRVLKRDKPQALVAHFSTGATLPLLLGFILHVPIRIYFNHGLPYLGYTGIVRYLLVALEWLNCLLATEIVTVSSGIKHRISNEITRTKPVSIIHNGSAAGLRFTEKSYKKVQEKKILYKNEFNISTQEIVLLYVGRPVNRKGFNTLISICNELTRTNCNFRVFIAGFESDEIPQASVSSNHYQNINYLGFVKDLKPYYLLSDIVILPSRHEGFGYALVEGASLGSIPIASDIDGPRDYIVNGTNGFLINPNDVAGFCEIITTLSRNTAKRDQLARNAFKSVKCYGLDQFKEHYAYYFNAVLNAHPQNAK
ncbi:MAG: glycosyltransferase [Candidatus Sedimenticola endophacoides]